MSHGKRTARDRIAVVVVALIAMIAAPRSASGQSLLTLETTVDGNVVTVDLTIEDNGGATDCAAFHLVRTTVLYSDPAVETRCIPRQIGTTAHHQFIDTLPANRAYHYTVVGMSCFAPCVCVTESDQAVFSNAFGNAWGSGFHAYANTGPAESTPFAHGHIIGFGNSFPPYAIEGCPGTESLGAFLSLDALQYVDTGADVLVYGTASFDIQNGPILSAAKAVPWACEDPVAVESGTWGSVKSLYR